MMSRVREVLRLRFVTNLSIRQSAISANVSKSTASDYCKRFKMTGIDIGSSGELDYSKLITQIDTSLTEMANQPDIIDYNECIDKLRRVA